MSITLPNFWHLIQSLSPLPPDTASVWYPQFPFSYHSHAVARGNWPLQDLRHSSQVKSPGNVQTPSFCSCPCWSRHQPDSGNSELECVILWHILFVLLEHNWLSYWHLAIVSSIIPSGFFLHCVIEFQKGPQISRSLSKEVRAANGSQYPRHSSGTFFFLQHFSWGVTRNRRNEISI